jgi:DNA invertase Pin-like site-specific DNA recombinase
MLSSLSRLPQTSRSEFWQLIATASLSLLAERKSPVSLIDYARTSTSHQEAGLEAQIRRLTELGCDKIFSEQVSSIAERTKLNRALEYVREGDTFVVTKLDRLARSVAHLVEISRELERKGVKLKILDMGIDTGTPTGRLFLNIVGSIAQFEREVMLERQRDGIAAAKAAGKFKGRKPTARGKTAEIRGLAATGMTRLEIARRLGISARSVYRFLSSAG